MSWKVKQAWCSQLLQNTGQMRQRAVTWEKGRAVPGTVIDLGAIHGGLSAVRKSRDPFPAPLGEVAETRRGLPPPPPYSCHFSPSLNTQGTAKTRWTLSFCVLLMWWWVQGEQTAAGALPTALLCSPFLPRLPRRPTTHAGDVTRACCTLAISSARRSPPRKKTQVSPSEEASPAQGRRTEELRFFFNLSHKV